ncbi:MAG: hypothetical protein AAGG68_15860 [Bacteroidota bacterium]
MRTLHYTILLTLLYIASLSAQSLYQDALTLAEILRKEQQKSYQIEANELPKLVLIKERRGIHCYFTDNPPNVSAAEGSGLVVPINEVNYDSTKTEVRANYKSLEEYGYFHLKHLTLMDTIEIAFSPDQKRKIYFAEDSLFILNAMEDSLLTLEYKFDSTFTLSNTYQALYVFGTKEIHRIEKVEVEENPITAFVPKLLLRPKSWNVAPKKSFQLFDGTTAKQAMLSKHELILSEGQTYTFSGAVWEDYLYYIKQQGALLSEEAQPIRVFDTMRISYNPAAQKVEMYNNEFAKRATIVPKEIKNLSEKIDSLQLLTILQKKGFKKDSLTKTEQALFKEELDASYRTTFLQLHGFLPYTSNQKDSILALNASILLKHLEPASEQNCEVFRLYSSSLKVEIAPPFDTSYFKNGLYNIRADGNSEYVVRYTKDLGKDTSVLFVFTDVLGNLVTLTPELYKEVEKNYLEGEKVEYTDLGIFVENTGNKRFIEISTRLNSDYYDLRYHTRYKTLPRYYSTKSYQDLIAILAVHQNFSTSITPDEFNLEETLQPYRKNVLLSQPLARYLINPPSKQSAVLAQQLEIAYEENYPWKKVLYEQEGLNLEKKVSYQDLTATYRQTRPTASQNLQLSTAELESKRRRSAGGLDASTIAAGLSDFIVERAQDELNITFMDRMKENITIKYPEFAILFPNTLTTLTNFEVKQYRSLLGFSRTSFLTDLDNMGITFPRLFELEKYKILADDPNVYNISLIYDIANKVYEDTSIDSVMLHLHTRLNKRIDDLDNRVLRTLSGGLLADLETQKEKRKGIGDKKAQLEYLSEQSQNLMQTLYQFDLMTEIGKNGTETILEYADRAEEELAIEEQFKKYTPPRTPYSSELIASELPSDENSFLPYHGRIETASDSITTKAVQFGGQRINLFSLPDSTQKAMDSLLIYERPDTVYDQIKQLKEYELLIPAALDAKILYDYQMKKLPLAQFNEYFERVPEDSVIVMEGLNLLQAFLKGDQIAVRKEYLEKFMVTTDTLLQQLKVIEKKKADEAYSPLVIAAARMQYQYEVIDYILEQRILSLETMAKEENLEEEIEEELENALALTDVLVQEVQKIIDAYIQTAKDQEQATPETITLEDGSKGTRKVKKATTKGKIDQTIEGGPTVVGKFKYNGNNKAPKIKIRSISGDFGAAGAKITNLLVSRLSSMEASVKREDTKKKAAEIVKKFTKQPKLEVAEIAAAVQASLNKKISKLEGSLSDTTINITSDLEKLLPERENILIIEIRDSLIQLDVQRILDKHYIPLLYQSRNEQVEKKVNALLSGYLKDSRKQQSNGAAQQANKKELLSNTKDLFNQQLKKLGIGKDLKDIEKYYSKSLIHKSYSVSYLRQKLDSLSASVSTIIEQYEPSDENPLSPNQERVMRESVYQFDELLFKTINELNAVDVQYNINPYSNLIEFLPPPKQEQTDQLLKSVYKLPEAVQEAYLQPNYYYASKLDTLYRESQESIELPDVAALEQIARAEVIVVGGISELTPVKYFEQLSTMNNSMSLWLTDIEQQFDYLSHHLDTLETRYAEKACKARQQAQVLSTLSEIGIHIMDAFRTGSMEVDSIVQIRNIQQNVELEAEKGKKISFTSNEAQTVNLAKGKGVKKWISRQEFTAIMDDPLTRKAYLGLLYQRLSNINGRGNITPEGIALVSTKLIGTIYDINELRAQIKQQKKEGNTPSFKDYYPFVRSSVDFLNILLDTPMGNQSFSQQYQDLRNFTKISDQSLSLFENIYAKSYGEAIQNLVNLFTYIWDVDIEEAQEEQRLIQALPTLASNKKASKSQKQAVKVYKKQSNRFQKALLVYGSFMAKVVAAQDADAVKAAIASAAVPPGSSTVKRSSNFNVAVNGYFGGGYYRETLTAQQVEQNKQSGSAGLAVPVGITTSVGGLGKNDNWSFSLFIPVLDIGAVTTYRIDQQNIGASGNLPELTFGNLIAPGGYLIINLPKSPFSISGGAQFGPQARTITVNGVDLQSSAWRYGFTATIDVPIFNLFNR